MATPLTLLAQKPERPKARIAITLDLEMSRNFPAWTDTHWDYEKGNLDDETKRYSVNAADRVRQRGGRIHFFAVGRVFEQEDTSWLQHTVSSGHPIGNPTCRRFWISTAREMAIASSELAHLTTNRLGVLPP